MRTHRISHPVLAALLAAACVIAALVLVAPRAHGGYLYGHATHSDAATVHYSFTFTEVSGFPSGHPEWVGFDVYRRAIQECLPSVRVNAEPFPRALNQSHSYALDDVPPDAATLYEYRVELVDAQRNPVSVQSWECDPCASQAWAAVPDQSAPVAIGTLIDGGWTLILNPCSGTCFTALNLENGCCIDELRQYAGTSAIVRLFGQAGCGSIDGCSIAVDHWDLGACVTPIPTIPMTWGTLKLRYR